MPFPRELSVPVAQASGKDPTTNCHLLTLTALSKRPHQHRSNKINQHLSLHLKRATLLKTIYSD